MSIKKKGILFLAIVVLVIVSTPIFGGFYEKIIGRNITSWFPGSHPEYFEGFFLSYMFIASLLLTLFGGNNKYKVIAWAIGLVLLLSLVSLEVFIVSLVTAIVGFVIAQIILLISKKFKKS